MFKSVIKNDFEFFGKMTRKNIITKPRLRNQNWREALRKDYFVIINKVFRSQKQFLDRFTINL